MTLNGQQAVRLEFTSAVEMLDFVQVVSDHVGRTIGLDEDAVHWVGVALRESVINAIKHGNRNDASKRVFVEFQSASEGSEARLTISVRDQGEGFDPETLEDLKSLKLPALLAIACFVGKTRLIDNCVLR